MKNRILFIALFLAGNTILSCKKEAGIGGDASIRGKVHAKHYNGTFTNLITEYDAPDEYVYIIFGNDVSYGKRIKTSYDGQFEFKYLYEGDYRIYVYSIDSAAYVNNPSIPHPDAAVIKNVTISERKQEEDIGTLTIFK
jgi:hypothetical protein